MVIKAGIEALVRQEAKSETLLMLSLLGIGIWWLLGPLFAVVFSGSAQYDRQHKDLGEDGKVIRTKKERRKLQGWKLRSFLHIVISAALVIVCYGCLYRTYILYLA